MGGESFDKSRKNHDVAGVVRLTWNARTKQLRVEDNALPPLPKASSYHAGAVIGDTIYVAASHARDETSRRLDVKALWRLNLTAAKAERQWQSLPVWPGPPRYKMALATAELGEGKRGTRQQLFLLSGSNWAQDAAGEFDLSKFEYYDDAFRFDPATEKWTALSPLPKLKDSREIQTAGYRFETSANSWLPAEENAATSDVHALFEDTPQAAAAAVAISDDAGRVLLFSGSTGRYLTMDVKDRPAFPTEVLAYDVRTDRWHIAGHMPTAVVTTGLTRWQGQIVIASGETRPGVRTRKVQALVVE